MTAMVMEGGRFKAREIELGKAPELQTVKPGNKLREYALEDVEFGIGHLENAVKWLEMAIDPALGPGRMMTGERDRIASYITEIQVMKTDMEKALAGWKAEG